METRNALGAFLRARRERTDPEQAGVVLASRRRTPGLRREEVALLAGVSTDYYTRLEQGRERHPSDQVLDALARTLGLDAEETAHLHRLAKAAPAGTRRGGGDRADPSLLQLMEGWDHAPVLVLGHRMDVLAANRLGRALHARMVEANEDNLVRFIFLHPAARELYDNWDRVARSALAALRSASGLRPDDSRMNELVGGLSVRSAEFRTLWARHDVRAKRREVKQFRHHEVGELNLSYDSLTVNGIADQQLIVYRAEDEGTRQALVLLGALAAEYPADSTPGKRSIPDSARQPSDR
ncbi:Helix-turn-helix domain-containing protein [Lentzea xinjiangensis]|uniref:Helix-turn-helix domain-containing protein n=1 Tax=Lentzea xinjiangensis TaxID=402600 RepID=A0A1H9UDM4_9PSEU|nr:helix-turn-helix transcriptional regulator [Lentzea xinjiangensis]SES07449.1 Helix-turn-helix domain-containing protein [Lentzea xinjiangensis]